MFSNCRKSIAALIVMLFLFACPFFSACSDSEVDTSLDKFGLITWENEPSEEIIDVCGFSSSNYKFTYKSIPGIGDSVEGTNTDVLQNEADVEDWADHYVTQGYTVVAFQMNDWYNKIAYDFMSKHDNVNVFILDVTGTEILDYQLSNEDEDFTSSDSEDLNETDAETDINRLVASTVDSDYGGFYILRNGENILLRNADNNGKSLYQENIVFNDGLEGFYSFGEVPVPTLENGDEVVSYSNNDVPVLHLSEINFYGSSIGVTYADKRLGYYDPYSETGVSFISNADNIEVSGMNGLAEDWYDLDDGEYYTVGYYIGTQYEEITLQACCNVYTYNNSMYEFDYTLEGELTKNGYAKYDLSSIPSGLYVLSGGVSNWRNGVLRVE